MKGACLTVHTRAPLVFQGLDDSAWFTCERFAATVEASGAEGDALTVFLSNMTWAKALADAIYSHCRTRAKQIEAQTAALVADIPEEGSLEAIERAQDAALGQAETAAEEKAR